MTVNYIVRQLGGLCLFLGLIIAGAPSAHAAKVQDADSDSFEIGLEAEDYQYREPNLDKDVGFGYGLEGTYTFTHNKFFFKANALVDFYDLAYSSNGTGKKNGITDYKQDYRGLFGREFKLNKSTSISPFTGVGFRMLFDSGKAPTDSGALGYDRRSEYLYIPLGASMNIKAGKWLLTPSAEYDYLVQGWQTSYFSDLGFDNNIYNNQDVGYGLRASFRVTPPLDFHNFSFGPYIRYWSIHDSSQSNLYYGGVLVGTGLEPANNTVEAGMDASIKF